MNISRNLILTLVLVLPLSGFSQSENKRVIFPSQGNFYPPYQIKRTAVQKTNINILLEGNEQKQSVSSWMTSVQTCKPSNPTTNLQQVEMWVTDINGTLKTSEMSMPIPNVDTNISRVTYYLDNRGIIQDFEGNEEYLKSLTQTGLFAVQKGRNLWSFLRNDKDLRIGDTLTESKKGNPLSFEAMYVLKSVDGGQAIFEVKQKIELNQSYEAQGLQMNQNVKGSMNGSLIVRVADRMVLNSNMDIALEGTMDMVYLKAPITIRGNITENAEQI